MIIYLIVIIWHIAYLNVHSDDLKYFFFISSPKSIELVFYYGWIVLTQSTKRVNNCKHFTWNKSGLNSALGAPYGKFIQVGLCMRAKCLHEAQIVKSCHNSTLRAQNRKILTMDVWGKPFNKRWIFDELSL